MTNQAAAVLAFFALGANVLAVGLHLLINPSHRVARWFIGWTVAWSVVLLAQGMYLLSGTSATWLWLLERAVFLLPAFFVAFALVIGQGWRAGLAVCPLACWVVLALMVGGDLDQAPSWVESLWYGMWIFGTVTLVGCKQQPAFRGQGGQLARRLLAASLLMFVPVTIVATLFGGNWYSLYVAPLSSILLQFLIFLGVLHFRFYDVEITTARRGDMAARAAEAERLAVVGELAASVAHEVRNPLTGVRSLAQRLADDTVDEAKRRDYARIILNEVGRVEAIVSSLLNLAKGAKSDGGEITPTALEPLFSDLSLLLTRRAQNGGVVIGTDANDITVDTSPDALSQALLNLLLNAIHHTPAGGKVDLIAERNGGCVDILVQDQGPGIPPDERDQVFEPFRTSSGGTGLGLAVVRRLAREQGWQVTVDDSPLGGAEFRLQIPT